MGPHKDKFFALWAKERLRICEKKRREELEEIARLGTELNYASKNVQRSHEDLLKLLKDYNLYEVWENNYEENIKLDCFKEARDYCENSVKGGVSLNKVISVLAEYNNSRIRGEKSSYKKISEYAGVSPMTVRQILLRTGRKSLNFTVKAHRKNTTARKGLIPSGQV